MRSGNCTVSYGYVNEYGFKTIFEKETDYPKMKMVTFYSQYVSPNLFDFSSSSQQVFKNVFFFVNTMKVNGV